MSLFGKSGRQSVLDDDSAFYQPQIKKSEKQKWLEMDAKQRLRYFMDYYLLKSIFLVSGIIIAVVILWSLIRPQKDRMLFLAIVQNSLLTEGKEQLEQELGDVLITDPARQEIMLDDSFPTGYETEAKLMAYVGSKEVDLIVTNETYFKQLAENGAFEDLNEFLPGLAEEHADLLYWTDAYIENSSTSNDESEKIGADAGQKPDSNDQIQKAYGIRITDCRAFKKAWYDESEAVAGIVVNSQRKENAKTAFTEYLFSS